MEPSSLTSSPDKSDLKPSFRKPTSDAASRKYRRHSPVSRSDSSSSGGSPRHERSHSPLHSRKDRTRTSDDQRRKDAGRELERDSSRSRSSRGHDSQKHSERHSYGNSHDYRRHDDYNRHHGHVDEGSRNYRRSSRSGQESRNDSRCDYAKNERISDRYRDSWRNVDNNSKDKIEISEHKEREPVKGYDRADTGSKQVGLSRDFDKISGQDQRKDRESRDYKKDYRRSPGSYKNDQAASRDGLRGYGKDSTQERNTGARRESEKSSKKDYGREDLVPKRKYAEMEGDKHGEKYTRGQVEYPTERRSSFSHQDRDGKSEEDVDKTSDLIDKQNSLSTGLKDSNLEYGNAIDVPSSSSRQVKEMNEKVNSESMNSITNNADATNDVNSAKVAALKAAELVNRNLVGFGGAGCMSTDQKKKLLWGNKKNSSTEEPSGRWDLHLFSDQERQEKFNRLMGVKGNVAPEHKPDNNDGSHQAKKQEELDTDLEKQYTAGLRRRDGRTVGLGL